MGSSLFGSRIFLTEMQAEENERIKGKSFKNILSIHGI